ncbi:MAG: GntR family transcriptional regulator [Treponema sp.]|jgi:DNA-binding GntR family transcriptional regulator|nr:GntR family transcriptional regulator [Treponema sp.]
MYSGSDKSSRTGNAKETVYSILRKSIVNLNLLPGAAISEKEISLRFKVSRTPVREAFIHLSRDGLVQVIPQRETRVSRIDLRRVWQEFFLRKSLEESVMELFLRNAGPESFARLEHFLGLQKQALDNKSFTDFIDYDDAFHRVFFEDSGQEFSWKILSRMCGHYHRVRLLSIWIVGIGEEKFEQHENLLAAARENDLERARAILHLHLYKFFDEESKLLREEFPGYFAGEDEDDVLDQDFGGFPVLTAQNAARRRSGKTIEVP